MVPAGDGGRSRPSFLILDPCAYSTWIFPPGEAESTPFVVPHEDYLLTLREGSQVDPARCLEIARAYSGRFDYIVAEAMAGFLWHALFRLGGDQTPFVLVPRLNQVSAPQSYAMLLSSQLRGSRDVLFAACRAAARSCAKFGFYSEPRRLPGYDLPGTDLELFHPLPDREALRTALALPVHRDVLLFTGRVARDKHLLELFEAFAAVLAERPAELVVISHTQDESYLALCRERAAAIGHIRFVESVDVETLVRYYNAADLFVSAGVSIYETFGRSPVEAMACGTPSVVSAFNGFRDTITPSTGFLVPTVRKNGRGWPQRPDIGRFAATILAALADREALREKSRAGRRRVHRWGRAAVLPRVLKLLAQHPGSGDAPCRDRLSLAEYPTEVAGLWGDLEGQPLVDLVTRFITTGKPPYEPSRDAIMAFYEFWFEDY